MVDRCARRGGGGELGDNDVPGSAEHEWLYLKAGSCPTPKGQVRLQLVDLLESRIRDGFAYAPNTKTPYEKVLRNYLDRVGKIDSSFRSRYIGRAEDLIENIEEKFTRAPLKLHLFKEDFRWGGDDPRFVGKCSHQTVMRVHVQAEAGSVDMGLFSNLDPMSKAALVLHVLILSDMRAREHQAPFDEWRTRRIIGVVFAKELTPELYDQRVRGYLD